MKFNASIKRSKQTYMRWVLILIPIGNDQTPSRYLSALCPALTDANTPSAHGLENNSACNKYQANSLKGLSKQTGQIVQPSICALKLTLHKIFF